jgi:hypothetical protein
VLRAFEAYLTRFFAEYGDYIDYFNIGNEIDLYFGGHPDEWKAYLTFFKHGASVVRRLRPSIKLGAVMTHDSVERYWPDIEPYCDYLAFTYYAPCSMFEENPTSQALDSQSDKYFVRSLDGALDFAGEKPVVITEIGCATAASVDSSPELQAQFIEALFEWLRGKEDKILGLSWLGLHDWSYTWVMEQLEGFLSDELLANQGMIGYLTSLGLTDAWGKRKPGFEAFKREMRRYAE